MHTECQLEQLRALTELPFPLQGTPETATLQGRLWELGPCLITQYILKISIMGPKPGSRRTRIIADGDRGSVDPRYSRNYLHGCVALLKTLARPHGERIAGL